jgi:hypothetical protein
LPDVLPSDLNLETYVGKMTAAALRVCGRNRTSMCRSSALAEMIDMTPYLVIGVGCSPLLSSIAIEVLLVGHR